MEDPDPVMGIVLKLILLLILILLNAFFAMSEIAIISLNDNKIRMLAEDGDKKANKILKLVSSPSMFLSTIQIGVTLAGFLASASASQSFAEPLAKVLAKLFGMKAPTSFLSGLSMFLVTVLISYFSLVLGELVPKRIAMQKAETISNKIVAILLFIKKALSPFVWFLSVSTNLVVRMLGMDPNANEEVVTEEEIRMLVDAGEEKGVIEESQKEMINNIFEFDDINAGDVMTHRSDVKCLEATDSLAEAIEVGFKKGYSRIPVYEDDIDNIIGILYVKDLLKYVGKPLPKNFNLQSVVRKAFFVPETKLCGELFNEMTEKHVQMVIVSDEYGSTVGIVTLEDLLESIVGNIQDEYDNEEEEIKRINDNLFYFDGSTDIDEVEETLDIELPDGEFDSIGGFILSELGRFPEENEKPFVEESGFKFTIWEMIDRRIEKVKVERLKDNKEKGE